MADRKASVALELKAGQFKAEATEAEAKVEGLDRSVEKLDRSITKIPPDAAKAAAAMKLLGDESGKAGVKLDDLGKRSTSLGAIDQQIAKTRSEMRGLADEFNRTGNASVLQTFFGKQGELKDLERLKKNITGALDAGAKEGGKAGAASFASSFGSTFDGASGKLMTGAIVAGVAAAFFTASGPILAATGLTGIAAGVVGQLEDPRVRKAFADMGHDLSRELNTATSSFRQPLIESAGIFGEALRRSISSINFSSLSKMLVPLASGTGGLLTNMMPGFNKALEAARPVLQALAQELPKLGSAISDMFEKFARGKDGAVIAIKLIIDVLRVLAEVIGNVVEVGAKLTEWITTNLAKAFHAISEAAGVLHLKGLKQGADEVATALDNLSNTDTSGLDKFGTSATKAGDDLSQLSSKIAATEVTVDSLAAQMSQKMFSEIMNVDQATLGWNKSLLDLRDTLSQNGLAIDRHTGLVNMNTQAGIANRSAVLQAMTANMQQYQSFIAAGGSADDATKAYDANTTSLEKQLRAAGYNTSQIDDMIGSLKNVPHGVQTDIAMNGLTEAVDHLSDLLAYLNHIDKRNIGFTVHETDMRTEINDPNNAGHGPQRWGGIYQHAATGLLRGAEVYSSANPGRYMIAEPSTGGEAFVPRFGDYGRSTSILDQAARWYGGRFVAGGWGGGGGTTVSYTVNVHALDARAAGPVVIEAIKSYERSNGTNWRNVP